MKHFIKRSPSRLFLTISLLTLSVVLFALRTASAQDANPFPFEKDVQRYEQISAENPPSSDNTFFVGSSTFTIWKEIPEDFAEYKAINRGFGGSQISHWLDVAAERILKPYKPRRIVFFCGCNDIASGKSPEQVFENFQTFVEMMRDANPNVVIHFCALHMPPVREKHWEDFRKLNADVEALAEKDPNIYYIDFAGATSDENGAGIPELFQNDRLHLTREGEKVLVPVIKESIEKEISDKSRERATWYPAPVKNFFRERDFSTSDVDLELPSQVPVKHKLGNWTVAFDRENDDVVVALTSSPNEDAAPFAVTKIPSDDVIRIKATRATSADPELTVEYLQFYLKSTGILTFSDANVKRNFMTIDYSFTNFERLTFEAPLVWEFPNFDSERISELKAFGTAGLKPVDGHKGSYAFLSIVDPANRSGVVGGWITSEKAGGVLMSGKTDANIPTMTPQLDFGDYQNERVITERFVLGEFDDCRIGLENYADAIATYYSIVPNKEALTGYCTWYSDKNGGCSNENAMKELTTSIVDNFDGFGFQYVQIDDKWQLGNSKNGPNKNFTAHNPNGPYPSGMKATADLLNANGLRAGLWFMPFSGNYDDPYWADKQDLFVRSAVDYPEEGQKNTRRYSNITQRKGAPYETFWGGTSLDMSNPKTIDYVKDVVKRITQDWNFKFVKIDGMWVAGAIEQLYVNDEYMSEDIGKQIFFDRTRTNIENFRTGMETVRQEAKDTFILGCNVSQNMRALASSYGLVDAMRVGPDNGASWDGVCAGPWRGTNRYFYNGRVWYNDPDPVYARTSIPIERARVSASWAAISGQLYALSDWIPDYDEARIDLVHKTIPNHQCVNVRPVDLFDVDLARVWILTDDKSGVRRDVVAIFNWRGGDDEPFEFSPEKLGLPLVDENGQKIEQYVAYNFWDDEFIEPFDTLKTTLAKETCKVFAVRPVGDCPVLLSTSRHVAQCVVDVVSEHWDAETETLHIVANIPPKFQYELRVYNPTTGRLDRWTAPAECVGTQSFQYQINDAGEGVFTVVKAENDSK